MTVISPRMLCKHPGFYYAIEQVLWFGGLRSIAILMAQGGKFEHGFFSGFVSSLGGSYIGTQSNPAIRIAMSAAIGGTAEALGGGKFANGAVTGAYVMMLNHMGEHGGNPKNEVDANSGAAIDKYGPIHEYYFMTEEAFRSLPFAEQQTLITDAKFYIDNQY